MQISNPCSSGLPTQYRRGVFTKEILNELRSIFSSVCRDFDADLVEFDGEDDPVHLLVNYPPKVTVSKLVNSLKGVSRHIPQNISLANLFGTVKPEKYKYYPKVSKEKGKEFAISSLF